MKAGLRYVYIGNVPSHPANSTWCPQCGGQVISRAGFSVLAMNLKGNTCAACGNRIAGVGLAPA
jgi:pyruvate formate lyase activating enzyme